MLTRDELDVVQEAIRSIVDARRKIKPLALGESFDTSRRLYESYLRLLQVENDIRETIRDDES